MWNIEEQTECALLEEVKLKGRKQMFTSVIINAVK